MKTDIGYLGQPGWVSFKLPPWVSFTLPLTGAGGAAAQAGRVAAERVAQTAGRVIGKEVTNVAKVAPKAGVLLDETPLVAAKGAGAVTSEGAASAVNYSKLKLDLKTTQAANEVVDSLKTTGQLPSNYVTKAQAYQQGWQEGKAVNNAVPGGQIGGDVFKNTDGLLPTVQGRTWYEADIGLSNTMARGNAAQPASRLLYSSDGLLYVTPDHYKTAIPIGRWKN